MFVYGPSSFAPGLNSWGSTLAMDRASVRTTDHDGRLHVAVANVSKAAVNEYRGSEVPDAAALGLDPHRIYQILRDPEELAKSVRTFNNIPVLSSHVPVSVDDHRPDLVVGSTGTDAAFVAPFMRCSLVFWAASAIRGIQSGEKRELSAAYRYKAVPDTGTFQGARYTLRMTQIRANHISVVDRGRAGPDVVVGDGAMPENPNIKMEDDVRFSKLLSYLQDCLSADQLNDVDAIVAGKEVLKGGGLAEDRLLRRRQRPLDETQGGRFPNASRLK